jgi:acetyl-CoA C-acetyltransferase
VAEAFIYDCVRTPRGRGGPDGSLHEVTTLSLAANLLKGLIARNRLDTYLIDDVILGCADPIGEAGGNIARAAVLAAGLDHDDFGSNRSKIMSETSDISDVSNNVIDSNKLERDSADKFTQSASNLIAPGKPVPTFPHPALEHIPGLQINRFCASGLDAVNLAAAQIMADQQIFAIAGGVESMSRVGPGASGGAFAMDPSLVLEGTFIPQGVVADLIATKYGFSRADVDGYAVLSRQRAVEAATRTAPSLMPVCDVNGLCILDHDELATASFDLDGMSHLPPAFAALGEKFGFDAVAIDACPEVETIFHVHHAGNSAAPADGAAMVLLGSSDAQSMTGLTARARICAFATAGIKPVAMLTGCVEAAQKALSRARLSVEDIDLFEVNESFSAVVLRFIEALNLDLARVNVNGGAIACGHPLGATGAMLICSALDELERRGKSRALIAIGTPLGMGTATIIERL